MRLPFRWPVALAVLGLLSSQCIGSDLPVLSSPFEPIDPLTNFVINIHATLDDDPATDPVPPSVGAVIRRTMTDKNGSQFVCYVPLNDPKTSETSDQLTVTKIEECAAAVSRMSQECSRLTREPSDSLVYEICPDLRFTLLQTNQDNSVAEKFGATLVHGEDRIGTLPDGRVSFVQTYRSDVNSDSDSPVVATVRYECPPDDREIQGLDRTLPAEESHGIVKVTEPSPNNFDVLMHVHDETVCSFLLSSSDLLKPINGTCIRMEAGWWTYSVCIGSTIRQFHMEADKKISAEYSLGTYDWASGEPVITKKPVSAILQRYKHGDSCGAAAGVVRTTSLRFECIPVGGPIIKGFREVETCTYEFVIGYAGVCDFPGLEPPETVPQNTEPRTINCHPRTEVAE